MPYRVYLPPDYDAPADAGRRYPVIYLLHGNGGRCDEWSGYGLQEVANQLVQDGRFGHTIVVMPQGGRSYWVNHEGGLPWGDYVVRDVVRHVDATYRTIARREARAIGGSPWGVTGNCS
jgi:enterochelin esterase-like enzyme